MAITNGYCTLDQLKHRLDIPDGDYQDDISLELVIEAVSRWIDRNRNRRIYTAAETRYYSPISADYVTIDDLVSLTTLKTDPGFDGTYEDTWTSSDYQLAPFNANTIGEPYTRIEKAVNGDYSFTVGQKTVEVVGTFGYASTTPNGIREACLLASARLWRRKDNLFGVAGFSDLGTVLNIVPAVADGELKMMLSEVPKRITV